MVRAQQWVSKTVPPSPSPSLAPKPTADIKPVLKAFENIRKLRAALIASTSAMLGKMWQMPDGSVQKERDERMKKMPMWEKGGADWEKGGGDGVPGGLRDPRYQSWVMGFDVVDFVS